jgi:hypothetical protein
MGMSPSETESGNTGEQAMSNEPKDVQFGDKELMKGAYDRMTDAQLEAAITLNLLCPFCKTALRVSAQAFKDGKVDRCAKCREESDDIIMAKQDAEEALAERNRKLLAVGYKPIPFSHCPGCGVKLDIIGCGEQDGMYHFGPDGCADQCGERGTEYYPIEFELQGKEGKRSGVTLGSNPQDAIKNFLAEYPMSGDCGTIVAIRVPRLDAGGLA